MVLRASTRVANHLCCWAPPSPSGPWGENASRYQGSPQQTCPCHQQHFAAPQLSLGRWTAPALHHEAPGGVLLHTRRTTERGARAAESAAQPGQLSAPPASRRGCWRRGKATALARLLPAAGGRAGSLRGQPACPRCLPAGPALPVLPTAPDPPEPKRSSSRLHEAQPGASGETVRHRSREGFRRAPQHRRRPSSPQTAIVMVAAYQLRCEIRAHDEDVGAPATAGRAARPRGLTR